MGMYTGNRQRSKEAEAVREEGLSGRGQFTYRNRKGSDSINGLSQVYNSRHCLSYRTLWWPGHIHIQTYKQE